MKIAKNWLAVLAPILLVACGGAGQAAPTQEAGAAPTEAPPEAPVEVAPIDPTATPQAYSEIEEMDEADFLTGAVTFTEMTGGWGAGGLGKSLQTLTLGAFQVNLTRAGPFARSEQDENYFRIHITAFNTTTVTQTFAPEGMSITDAEGNSYEVLLDAYERSFDIPINLEPQVEEKGYFLFRAVPDGLTEITVSFELGTDETGSPYKFEYVVDISDVKWAEE